ncbi:MAG TPA: hypothetical protein VF669_22745 [Tepidisphaeraceae bacterium]|jgi:type II secretory pathway component PulJ
MNRRHHHHRAFMLTELLMALFIAGFFFLAATKLFSSTMKVNYNVAEVHTQTVRLESAMALLRKDAWTAKEITQRENGVTLTAFDAASTEWAVDKEGVLSRTVTRSGKTAAMKWVVDVPRLKLEKRDLGIVVTIPESKRVRQAQIELPNQVSVAKGLLK